MTRYVPPSPKMVTFMLNLARDKVLHELGDTAEGRVATVQRGLDNNTIDKFQAMELIDKLKAAPRDSGDTGVKPGLYQRNGDIFLVKFNREKTGVYAKRLVPISGTRVTESDDDIKADWEYQPNFIQLVRPDDQMTLEEATPYLIRYTHCMICGRFLKAATSVRQSIGPVCIKMFQEPTVQPQLPEGTEDRLTSLLDQLKG